VFWQLARRSSPQAELLVSQHHVLPAALASGSLWLIPALFALGLVGPAGGHAAGQRMLGKHARGAW